VLRAEVTDANPMIAADSAAKDVFLQNRSVICFPSKVLPQLATHLNFYQIKDA
jgi:hypothetical protein